MKKNYIITFYEYAHLYIMSFITTKFHKILLSGFIRVVLTKNTQDRLTDWQSRQNVIPSTTGCMGYNYNLFLKKKPFTLYMHLKLYFNTKAIATNYSLISTVWTVNYLKCQKCLSTSIQHLYLLEVFNLLPIRQVPPLEQCLLSHTEFWQVWPLYPGRQSHWGVDPCKLLLLMVHFPETHQRNAWWTVTFLVRHSR